MTIIILKRIKFKGSWKRPVTFWGISLFDLPTPLLASTKPCSIYAHFKILFVNIIGVWAHKTTKRTLPYTFCFPLQLVARLAHDSASHTLPLLCTCDCKRERRERGGPSKYMADRLWGYELDKGETYTRKAKTAEKKREVSHREKR